MKITKKQLRKILMREFRDMGTYQNFDFGSSSGGGQLPPVEPPRRGGGGDGEGSGGFNGRNNNPCGSGSPKGDYYYDLVFNSFGTWIDTNYPLTLQDEEHNQEIISTDDFKRYDDLITQPSKYLDDLHQKYPQESTINGVRIPAFSMDLLSDDYNEFFELLMTAIAEYACANNIEDVVSIYSNPIPAIIDFNNN